LVQRRVRRFELLRRGTGKLWRESRRGGRSTLVTSDIRGSESAHLLSGYQRRCVLVGNKGLKWDKINTKQKIEVNPPVCKTLDRDLLTNLFSPKRSQKKRGKATREKSQGQERDPKKSRYGGDLVPPLAQTELRQLAHPCRSLVASRGPREKRSRLESRFIQ